MIERGEVLRLSLESSQTFGVVGEGVGQDLQRDVAMQLGVAGAIDLAHAAGTDGGLDLIRSESCARSERQGGVVAILTPNPQLPTSNDSQRPTPK